MIPDELTRLPQWVVAGNDKAPLNPRTLAYAAVDDPESWGTYEEALATGKPVGFVITAADPYVFIDLDNPGDDQQKMRHKRIFEATESYAELSVGGHGIHIIGRGSIPHGVRRDNVEVYSSSRYMICTGRVLRDLPIRDIQPLVDTLWAEMGGYAFEETELVDGPELSTDTEIVEMAEGAVNGEKFLRLCRGEWDGEYPSQSEADYALLSFLCFYSRNNAQIMRLFRMSNLGQRQKAQRNEYLLRAIAKIRRDEPTQLVDIEGLLNSLNGNGKHDNRPSVLSSSVGDGSNIWMVSEGVDQRSGVVDSSVGHDNTSFNPLHVRAFPPGFVGELAEYIFRSSPRPVVEVATAAALGLCAGIVGRQFNISGTGLNLYIIQLADTGAGKEGGGQGIERLMNAVRQIAPVAEQFLGPAALPSGQGLIRALDEHRCFVCLLGEFGLTLQTLSDANANTNSVYLRRVLLDAYSKSGKYGVIRESAYSDRTKNTKVIYGPAVSILGDSTPESFYGGLSVAHIADGLIPRFLIIEYDGKRPNRNPQAFDPPPVEIRDRLAYLASGCIQMEANNTFVDVELSVEAKALLDAFDVECDDHIRHGVNSGIKQMWNRAHLNALRVSGVLAAADRPHASVVTADEANWAINLVRSAAIRLETRFESGDIGEGDTKQSSDIERVLEDYVNRPWTEIEKYGGTMGMHRSQIVSLSYLSRRLAPLSAFRRAKNGSRKAIKEVIEELVNRGRLKPIAPSVVKKRFSSDSQCWFYVTQEQERIRRRSDKDNAG
jgi:hypothetical protein